MRAAEAGRCPVFSDPVGPAFYTGMSPGMAVGGDEARPGKFYKKEPGGFRAERSWQEGRDGEREELAGRRKTVKNRYQIPDPAGIAGRNGCGR